MDSLVRIGLLSAMLLGALTGCGGAHLDISDTNDDRSAELYGRIKVFSNGDDQPVLLMADIREGGGDLADRAQLEDDDLLLASRGRPIGELLGGDSVFDTVGDLSEHVEELQIQGRTYFRPYQVELTSPDRVAHGTRFATFNRDERVYVYLWRKDHETVGDSWTTLPPTFEIVTPTDAQTISRSEAIALSWSNPGSDDIMRLLVRGECEDGSVVDQQIDLGNDDGDQAIPASAFEGDIGNPGSTDCDLRLLLRRIHRGHINTGYGRGGLFEGIEQRWVDVRSTP